MSVVYFVHSPARNHVKVGTTDDAKARMTSLQTANSDRLVLLGTIPGGRREESSLHAKFALQRVHGEWFLYDDFVRSEIEYLLAKAAALGVASVPVVDEFAFVRIYRSLVARIDELGRRIAYDAGMALPRAKVSRAVIIERALDLYEQHLAVSDKTRAAVVRLDQTPEEERRDRRRT
jgi:hypothetical protein